VPRTHVHRPEQRRAAHREGRSRGRPLPERVPVRRHRLDQRPRRDSGQALRGQRSNRDRHREDRLGHVRGRATRCERRHDAEGAARDEHFVFGERAGDDQLRRDPDVRHHETDGFGDAPEAQRRAGRAGGRPRQRAGSAVSSGFRGHDRHRGRPARHAHRKLVGEPARRYRARRQGVIPGRAARSRWRLHDSGAMSREIGAHGPRPSDVSRRLHGPRSDDDGARRGAPLQPERRRRSDHAGNAVRGVRDDCLRRRRRPLRQQLLRGDRDVHCDVCARDCGWTRRGSRR
jgi:hypothetical protein